MSAKSLPCRTAAPVPERDWETDFHQLAKEQASVVKAADLLRAAGNALRANKSKGVTAAACTLVRSAMDELVQAAEHLTPEVAAQIDSPNDTSCDILRLWSLLAVAAIPLQAGNRVDGGTVTSEPLADLLLTVADQLGEGEDGDIEAGIAGRFERMLDGLARANSGRDPAVQPS